MKRCTKFFALILIFVFCFSGSLSSAATKRMSITSSAIKDGVIGDQYGKRGNQKKGSTPTLSLPLSVVDAPDGAVCFAVQMTDLDVTWVHWLAVNIETADLPENASISLASSMVQGKNSFGALGYGGPTPPDKLHTYLITVYALDAKVNLKNNFTQSQLKNAIKGHIMAEASIRGKYSN